MAETVVDDLEAVEVEIERRESAAAAPLFELFEATPEPLHEDRAVAQPGQRVEKCGATGLLLSGRSLRRIGQRSCDAGRATADAPHRDTAAEEAPIRAVLVADPVLVLKVIRLAREMCFESLLERSDVVGMDTVHPFLGTADAGGFGQAKHCPPSA